MHAGLVCTSHIIQVLCSTKMLAVLQPQQEAQLSAAHPASSRAWFLRSSPVVPHRHVNEGGLPLLYRILVDSAAPEIGTVMRLVLSGLEAQRPVLVFCKVW